jgi:hypothetical protein
MINTFSSIRLLNLYMRCGRVGLFFFIALKGIRYAIPGISKGKCFSDGWHDPIAPLIVKTVFGKDFRVSDRTKNHPYASIKLEELSVTSLDEDIYPLI